MMTTRCCGYDLLPYGHLSWILPVVTFLATCFFMFPSFRCSLTVARSEAGDFEMWYGYWTLENAEYALALGPEDDSNVCYRWGKGEYRDIFDGIWKLGKSIGVIGCFTTIPAAFANCVLLWSRFDLSWFYPLIAIHVFNAFMSFMLLIGLRSSFCESVNCVLARAGYVAVIAGFFWLLAAILLYFVRRKEAEMSANPNGVDLKDIENDEERLALPAPEEEHMALPAPGDDKKKKKKKKPVDSSREVPLALPPSESANEEKAPKRRNSARNGEPMSPSNRTNATEPESPRPSSSRRNSGSKSPRKVSPRKGKRPAVPSGEDGRPSTPRKSSSRSPKKGTTTPSSSGTKKKKKTTAKPNDIPEI